MPAFDYSAVDVSGRTVAGVLTAPDEAAARKTLARRRLMPLSLSRASGAAATEKTPRRSRKLSSRTLALTTRQLATLITVAPVDEALRTLMLQAERPDVRAVLSGVHAGVVEGQRLSEAMARQGAAFPPLYRATVAAGEASGAPRAADRATTPAMSVASASMRR